MDKKLKISPLLAWSIVLFFSLLCLIYLTQIWLSRRNSLVALPSSPVNLSRENNPAPSTEIATEIVNPKIATAQIAVRAYNPESAQPVAPPSISEQFLESQAGQQETQTAGASSVNLPMTDQQILASIQQQNQRQQASQRLIAKRDATAMQVIRNAQIAQSQPPGNQQVIPSSYSSPTAPADVQAKLKSHQLTAH